MPVQEKLHEEGVQVLPPKGACTDTGIVGGGSTICWANGATLSQGDGAVTVLGKRGRPCLTGTTGTGPADEFQITFVRKGKSYVFTANSDGTKSFTCPSGKVETHSGDDFRAGLACGHIPVQGIGSACTQGGTCP
jgi:hypothetical protein